MSRRGTDTGSAQPAQKRTGAGPETRRRPDNGTAAGTNKPACRRPGAHTMTARRD